jgi:hypothetical protein
MIDALRTAAEVYTRDAGSMQVDRLRQQFERQALEARELADKYARRLNLV